MSATAGLGKNEQLHIADDGVPDLGSNLVEARKNLMRDREFFLMLRQSIIDGMKKVLGEDNAIASLYYLMTSIERPVEFQRVLHSMFGYASYAFEKTILEELYGRANLPFRMQKGYQFTDYVEEVARMLVHDRLPSHPRTHRLNASPVQVSSNSE